MDRGIVVLAGRVTVLSLYDPDVDTSFRARVVFVLGLEATGVWVMEYGALVALDRSVVCELNCDNVLNEVSFGRPADGGIDNVEVGVYCISVEDVGLVVKLLADALIEAS